MPDQPSPQASPQASPQPTSEPAPAARGFIVRALGEIAIRCADLATMTGFYRDTLGLRVVPDGYRDGIVFFGLGESYGGHTAVLALFRDDADGRETPPVTGAGSALHHLAFTVDATEQAAVIAWYEAQGLAHRVVDFPWIGWRGVFTTDPEGNTVELVARVAPPTDAAPGR